MPEVVSPRTGDGVHWNTVFPIWDIKGSDEYDFINSILYRIAMNNRFGDKSNEDLQANLRVEMLNSVDKLLSANLEALRKLNNDHTDDDVPEDKKLLLQERERIWSQYGQMCFYIENVFANLGDVYREHK